MWNGSNTDNHLFLQSMLYDCFAAQELEQLWSPMDNCNDYNGFSKALDKEDHKQRSGEYGRSS